MNKRTLSIVLCFSIMFSIVFITDTKKANAYTTFSLPNFVPETFSATGTIGSFIRDNAERINTVLTQISNNAFKIAALLAIQKATQAIIGEGGGGVVTDWNKYLYISPQQRAMTQMNSFFNTVSRGRLSSLNYEGVGPNYDAYLIAQARQAIAGQPFTTNLQEFATDPTQMFTGGNMKGIMTYMQCANNVACYTMTAQSQYAKELTKATEIAKAEQDKGFLPVKKNGKITRPAALISSAFSQMDQLGTQVIMDAKSDDPAAISQITEGALISFAARNLNYATATPEGQAEIRDKNDQFPFSLSYSLNGGLGLNAGGMSINTGAGAIASQLQIGNTCATFAGSLDGGGAIVNINGKKYNCKTKTEVTGTKPSVK